MGGIGSGRRRTANSGIIEDVLALDLRALRRLGVVRGGECVIDTLFWSIGGLRSSYVRLRIDLSDINHCTMAITGEIDDDPVNQRISIEAVPSGFGGHRHYFICPIDGGRCEVLHYCDERFASRRAHLLSYASQSQDELGRARRRVAKLRRRLDGIGLVPKVRGGNRTRLVGELRNAQLAERSLQNESLRKILGGRSGARWMPISKD